MQIKDQCLTTANYFYIFKQGGSLSSATDRLPMKQSNQMTQLKKKKKGGKKGHNVPVINTRFCKCVLGFCRMKRPFDFLRNCEE